MSDATVLPSLTQLTYFKWDTPSAPNPRLSAPIDSDDQTISWTSAPLDESGSVITTPFLLGIKNSDSYVETIYCPNGADGASGLSATGCIRGVDPTGLDFTTNNDSFAASHGQESVVFCNISAVIQVLQVSAIQGIIATGGTGLIIGNDAAGTVTISHSSGAGTNLGFLRFNNATTKAQFSNDGVAWNDIDDVTGSNLVVVSANDTTPGVLNGKIVAGTNTTVTENNDGANETFQINAAGTLASIVTDVSTTEAEIDQALDGISANVTFTNLNTLTAGATSNASLLHTHPNPAISFIAGEAVTADDALALLPVEVEYFAQLTDVNLVFADVNARARYAIRFVPKVTTSTLTTMNFRAAEAVNNTTTLGNLTISIQLDAAGAPDGTDIANGTANVITQAVQRTWNVTQATRTATWAAAPTLTAGTTYWIVFQTAALDPVNFLNLGENSNDDENYIAFTRSTFDAFAVTWGNTVTNATPFFWFNSQPKLLGMGVVPTDSNVGGRTWAFIGFARTTQAIDTAVDVYHDIVPDLAGLIPGAVYYLDTGAGTITRTPDSDVSGAFTDFIYRIGRAISTTQLKIETGTKRVFVFESSIANTTVKQYDIWFRPDAVRVSGMSSLGSAVGVSEGFSLPDGASASNESSMFFAATNGVAFEAGFDATDSYHVEQTGAGNDLQARASNYTDIGFTYTFTEIGNQVGMAIIEITQQ